MSQGERLIAFEAALQELSGLHEVAARYRPLELDAQALLGELMDLGRDLRQAQRRGVFTDEVAEDRADHVRRLRQTWQRRLADLRASDLYRGALAAYADDEQPALAELLPALLAGVSISEQSGPFFRPLRLTTHRRSGGSPFKAPEAIAAELEELAREGLRPAAAGREWWDTDLGAIVLTGDLADVEVSAALRIESLPPRLRVFRERDAILVFTPRLEIVPAVVFATGSDDAWYEAAEGSYEAYRDAVVAVLHSRSISARVEPDWG
jgi:hypothetical protein